MKKSILISVILVAVLGISGCEKPDCGCKIDQPVVFQYDYINYAWGFRHHGFLIDGKGYIVGFQQPAKWMDPDSSGMITKADLEFNLSQGDTICGQVDIEDLERNFKKIMDIRSGKIIDNGMVMADAGTGVLSAWYWSENAQKYENVFLISNGDYSMENSHESVSSLVEWLKEIGAKTNRFYWFGTN